MIKVFLCDDHALIRRGIRDTLSDAPDIEVIGEAADYGELRALMRTHTADVLVLDINLPGRSGLDVLHVLKDEVTAMRVLVVSMYPEDQYAIRALRAGAYGYVNKGGDPAQIVNAVRIVVASSFSTCSTSRPLRPGRLMSSTSTSAVRSRISVRSSP